MHPHIQICDRLVQRKMDNFGLAVNGSALLLPTDPALIPPLGTHDLCGSGWLSRFSTSFALGLLPSLPFLKYHFPIISIWKTESLILI